MASIFDPTATSRSRHRPGVMTRLFVVLTSALLTVSPTQAVLGADEPVGPGLETAGTVTGVVWSDLDGDGVRGDDEPGLAGANLVLLGTDRGEFANVVSDEDGEYRFDSLAAGIYSVRADLPEGHEAGAVTEESNGEVVNSFAPAPSGSEQVVAETEQFELSAEAVVSRSAGLIPVEAAQVPTTTTLPAEDTTTTTTTLAEDTDPTPNPSEVEERPDDVGAAVDDPIVSPLSVGTPNTWINTNNTWYAYVGSGEDLDISFLRVGGTPNDATVRVRGPGGVDQSCTAPAGTPVGTGCTFTDLTSATPGVWQIDYSDLVVQGSLFTWEIDVQNGATSLPGRVYSENYTITQLSTSGLVDFSLWYQGEHGYQYRADYADYNGISSIFSADATGVAELDTCVSAYESMDFIGPGSDTGRLWLPPPGECGDPYKIFFEAPDASLPATAEMWDGSTVWLQSAVSIPELSNLAFTPDSPTLRSGEFTFDVTDFTGQLEIQVDVNDDGDYNDPEDRTVPAAVTQDGTVTVAFDGLDGLGNPIPATQDLGARVAITQVGEIHFVNVDVETRSGLSVEALNGPGDGSTTLYWNDIDLETAGRIGTTPPPDGTGGVDSSGGVHGWVCTNFAACNENDGVGGAWGDARNIDDWTFQTIDEFVELAIPGELPPAFVCDSTAYLFQDFPTDAWEGDLVTGVFTEVASAIEDAHINGIGYNPLDNYIYGWSNSTQPGGGAFPTGLVRVGSDYSVQYLGIPAALTATTTIGHGDVDSDGHYWARIAFTNDWLEIDLEPGSTTFGEVVDDGTWTVPTGLSVNPDWSFNPADGLLYGTASGPGGATHLISFDRSTHILSDEGPLAGVTTGSYGATYMDADGFLYISNNTSGEIFRVEIANATATFFAQGPGNTSQNDGARCPLPTLIDFGDAPDSYGTLLASDGARHGIPGYDEGAGTAPLMLGATIDSESDGQPSSGADGDGADEDGVADQIVLIVGEETDVDVVVTNNTTEPATLAGWIDLNDDGDFDDPGELQSLVVGAGSATTTQTLTFPAVGLPGDGTYARFRLFPGDVDPAELSPTGPAAAGEVEDYPVEGPVAVFLQCPSVYALQGGSPYNMYEVDTSTGDMTIVGQMGSGTGTNNGMGISADARYVFSHRNGEVLRYDTNSGVTDTFPGVAGLNSTHGGVDPSSGIYYYGNIASSAVYAFDPGSETNLGQVATLSFDVAPAGNNGDWSFDAQGNMYVVAGSTATSSLYVVSGLPTVDPPAPVAVTGAQITTFSTSGAAVNGIAFDATGSLYAASNAVIFEIDPSTGDVLDQQNLSPSGVSVDLSSCSTPATIVVQKDIVDRFTPGDQFEVTVTGGGIVENNVGTTEGTDTGPQTDTAETAGPVLGRPGTSYDISETGVSGADLGNYVTSWVCLNETAGGAEVSSGSGTSGSFVMPDSIDGVGAAIVCTFVNTPIVLLDFGDAPGGYGTTLASDGPRHEIVGGAGALRLGALIDAETDGLPSAGADGDDLDNLDDEDGIRFNADVSVPGRLETVFVNASGAGFLNGWIDFNLSGVFDANERIFNDQPVVAGVNILTYLVPTGADFVAGDSYARFRITSGAGQANTPTGLAPNGEVEDYTRTLFDAPGEALLLCPVGSVPIPVSIMQNPSFETRTGDFQNVGAANTINFAENWHDSHTTGGQYYFFSPTFDSGPAASVMPTRAGADGYAFLGGHTSASSQPVSNDAGEGATNTLAEPMIPGATYVGFFSQAVGGHNRQGNGYWRIFGTSNPNVGHIGPSAGVVAPTASNIESMYDTPTMTFPGVGVADTWEVSTFSLTPSQSWPYLRLEARNANPANNNTVAGQAWMIMDDFHMFLCQPQRDFGDAPDSYGTLLTGGGAYHDQTAYDPDTNTSPLMLGATIDVEADGFPSADADGDDTNNLADEDGVADDIVVSTGDPTSVTVSVTNTTGGDATLAGWIDLNGDGVFDAGELQTVTVTGSGDYTLNFPVSTTTTATYARFRLYPGDMADPQPVGPASGGEVEDYLVQVSAFDVAKTANPVSGTSVLPGSTVTYTLTLTNLGTVDLVGEEVDDDLSDVFDDADLTSGPLVVPAGAGTATVTGDVLSFVGDIPAGEQVTVSYMVTVLNPSDSGGDGVLANTVTGGDCPDPAITDPQDPEFDPDCVTVHPVRHVTIVKSSDPADGSTVAPGDTILYTVEITNTGGFEYTAGDPAEAIDDLSGVIDDAFYNGDADDGGHPGTISYTAPLLTWTGPLALDEVVTVTYTVTVLDGDNLGDAVLENVVTGVDSDCPDPANTDPQDPDYDPDCHNVVEVGAVHYLKTVDPPDPLSLQPGDTFTYTVTASNIGAVDLTGVTFTDDLTDVLDDATFVVGSETVDIGTAAFNGTDAVDWSGDLAVGEVATVTYQVTIDNPPGGDSLLINGVVGTGPGSNCPPPGPPTDADCFKQIPQPLINTVKTSDAVGNVEPGDVVEYEFTVSNDGTGPARIFEVIDDLTDVLDDAVYNVDVTLVSGPGGVVFDPVNQEIVWTGPLEVGEVATVTYSVTVNDATDLGDGELLNAVTSPDCFDPPVTDPDDPLFNPDCVTISDVEAWTAVKTSDAVGDVEPGDTVNYEITVTNTGNVALTAADVVNVDDLTEVLDDASYDGNAADGGHPGTFTFAAPTLTWSGDLAVDEIVTLTYSVTVNDATDLGDGQLLNAITGSTNCPAPAITDPQDPNFDPDCVVIDEVEAWTAVKTSDAVGNVEPGDTVNYEITVTNTGNVALTAADVVNVDDLTEVLDDASYDGNAADGGHPGTFTFADPTLTWSGDLAVDEVVTLTYSVTVNDATDLGDGQLLNAITGSSNCPDPAITDPQDPNFDPDCVVIDEVEAWTAVKTSDAVGDVAPGDTVNYEITVTNTGNVALTAADVVNVDDLTEVLDDASYDGNAADGGHPGTFTFASPDLTWSGDLAVDEVVTLTYSVTVNDATELGDGQLLNAITGSTNCPAPAITDPQDPDFDPDCVVIDEVEAWTAVKTSDAVGDVAPGDTVNYEITVTNTGNVALTAADVVNVDDLTEVLDDASYDGNADDGGHPGTFTFTAPTLTWSGDLAVDEVVTLTYSVTVNDATDLGDGQLLNAITGSTNCPDPAITDPTDPDFDPDCVNVEDVEAWTAAKTSDAVGDVEPGDTVNYEITVTNTGNVALTAADVVNVDDLTDVLDDAVYDGNAADGGHPGTFTFAAPTLTWSGDLAVDEVVTLTYSVTVNDATDLADGELLNAITGSSNCPDPAITDPTDPDFDPDCVVIEEVSAYTVVKTSDAPDPVLPGGVVAYTVVVTNTGGTDLVGPDAATFADDLSGVLDDATFNGDESADIGTVVFADPVLSWSGDLIVDQVATVTYSVTVDQPIGGDHQLENAVVGGDCPDPAVTDPDDPGFDPDCVNVIPLPGVHISKVVFGDAVEELQPGDSFDYVVTVTNIGQVDLVDEPFSDDLSEVLDDATLDVSSITADIGTATFSDPTLSWTGDLAIGEVATIRYTIIIDDPLTGDGAIRNGVVGSIYSNCVPPDPADPDCWQETPVPNVIVGKELVGPANPQPGDVVTYRITAENRGGAVAIDEEISDDLTGMLDDAVYNNDATAALSGVLSYAEPNLSWIGDIGAGETLVITYTVTVNDYDSLGDATLENVVTGGENCPEDTEVCETEDPLPTYEAEKTVVSPAQPEPGDTVTYQVTITNTSDVTADSAEVTDDLSGVLDDASYNGDGIATSGSVGYSEPTITWNGALTAGQVVSLTYSVTVNDADQLGDGVLENTVTAPNCGEHTDLTTQSHENCFTRNQVGAVNYEKTIISPDGSIRAGDEVTYQVTVSNIGTADLSGLEFTDDLSQVLEHASYGHDQTASIGTVTYQPEILTWTGDLAAGQNATVTYSVRLNSDAPPGAALDNVVVGNGPGSNCPVGSSDPDCVAVLSVSASSLPFTGFDLMRLMAAALALIIFGWFINQSARRRRFDAKGGE